MKLEMPKMFKDAYSNVVKFFAPKPVRPPARPAVAMPPTPVVVKKVFKAEDIKSAKDINEMKRYYTNDEIRVILSKFKAERPCTTPPAGYEDIDDMVRFSEYQQQVKRMCEISVSKKGTSYRPVCAHGVDNIHNCIDCARQSHDPHHPEQNNRPSVEPTSAFWEDQTYYRTNNG